MFFMENVVDKPVQRLWQSQKHLIDKDREPVDRAIYFFC